MATQPEEMQKACEVFVVYYSMYGHVHKLAQAIEKGAAKVEGVKIKMFQVPETLTPEVLTLMHAPPKAEAPIISAKDLTGADGIIFGFPTRFGMMCAQMKAFLDSTGGLWKTGGLIGKPAALFTSTGTQNGGQETTSLTAVTQLTHHGMVFVPIGYSTPLLFNMEEIKGGSPYGASTFSGDGSRQPSKIELDIAMHQGEYFAKFVRDLCKGRQQHASK